jgi:DNA-binding beta-propeller fold protein YncE
MTRIGSIASWFVSCLCFVIGAVPPLLAAEANAAAYSIAGHIPGGRGGAWDYAVVDSASGKLYLAQAGITALDLKDHTVTTGLVRANISHGVAALGAGRLAVDDSTTKEITVFDTGGKILATIPTEAQNPVDGMHALDALVVEPRSGLLVAVNGESGLLLLIDAAQARVVGSIAVGGHPEFAAADGLGTIFINVNRGRRSEIAGIDVAARAVVKHYPLSNCEGATGLAYDASAQLLLAVCDNGLFKALVADSGKTKASFRVGRGADAIMWDPKRQIAFVASGDSGTLSIISVRSRSDIVLSQVLPTQKGTRLGAIDIDTGILYLPAAKFGPPEPPIPYPSVVPGSFEFLIIAPN